MSDDLQRQKDIDWALQLEALIPTIVDKNVKANREQDLIEVKKRLKGKEE